MDIFFVISGYLISRILLRQLVSGRFSFAHFYAARVLRIFPALILVVAASLAIGWISLFPDEYSALARHALWGAGFVENFGLLKEHSYFDTATELKPLMHLWSLAVEEQFYLLFPALLWGIWRLRHNPLGLILAILALSFTLNVVGIGHHATRTFFLPQTRFWELMVGAVFAYIDLGKPTPPGAARLHWLDGDRPPTRPVFFNIDQAHLGPVGLCLLVMAILITPSGSTFPGWWALLPVMGAGLIVAAGPDASTNRWILASGPMRSLGLISYPLYLWHWPILSLSKIILSETPSVSIRAFSIGVCGLLAALTYVYVERPIRYGSRSMAVVRYLLLALGLLALTGLITNLNDGWPHRPIIQGTYAQLQEVRFYRPRDRNCDALHPVLAEGYCELSGESKPDLIVLGDSHANMLYWGLTKVLGSTGMTIANFGHPACLPFLDVSVHQRGEGDDCTKFMNEAIRLATANSRSEVIVLSARGPLYLSGHGYGDVPSERRLDILLEDHSTHPREGARKIFAEGLARTLDYFEANGKKVIFVIDLPELGFSPQACISRPLRAAARSDCSLPYADYMKRANEYRALVAEVIAHHANTKLFDASQVFCNEITCKAMDSGEMLYRDTDHPSLTGAVRIAKKMQADGLFK